MPSLSGIIKQASRGADLYFVFRFLRLLTMDWKKTDAYKYKIIDAKGNALKKSSELESVNEKAAYTMLHRMVFKIRRLIEKVPLIGKSILLNYAAALFLLKEQDDKRIWTDENYMERELLKFLESDWEEEAGQLKEVFRGQYGLTQANEFLTERTMTDGEKKKREEIVLSMKKKSSELKAKYGDDWENIMYATATKQAMGEEITADKGRSMRSFTEFQLDEIKFEAGKVYHQDTNDGPLYFKAGEQQKNKRWKGLVLDIGKKKPKSGSADETLRFWKVTPDKDIPPALKEEVEIEESPMLQAKMALSDAGLKHKEHNGKLIVNKKDKKKVQDALNKSFAKKGTPPELTIASGSFQEAIEIDEDAKMGKQSDDQLKKLYKTASEKDQSSPANKSFTKRVAKEMKKRGIQEESVELGEKRDVTPGKETAKEIAIAKKTLKMPAGRPLDKGGMTREQAKKILKKYEIVEEPANTVGGGGVNLDPHMKKKKKKPAWEDSRVLMNKFAGKDVFIVDSDMFHTCRMGKKKYHRYEKYVGIKRVGNAIREYGLKFPKRPIILQNGEDGPMLFLRYGRS